MSKHLVIGASGQVGGHLIKSLSTKGLAVTGTYLTCPLPELHRLDICNQTEVEELLYAWQPDVIYLPAALSNVDFCELHPTESYAINVRPVAGVVAVANRLNAKLVYFSSDYIFDGKAGPYLEQDPANPICEYGRQKLIAEHHIAAHARDYLIVRTTVVYGWEYQGKNFIYRLLSTLKRGEQIRVPVDQIGNPTYAPNLTASVTELVLKDARGIFNVAGLERVDRYEFAREAARVFGLNETLIAPVETKELNQTALRPLSAGLIMDKASATLDRPLLGYRDGLQEMAASAGEC